MAEHEELLRRLNLIQATLALAFEPQLAVAREAIRSDDVKAAILDEAEDWIGSSDLQRKVSTKTKKGERVVRDRFASLVGQCALEERGSERRKEYRRTGLI